MRAIDLYNKYQGMGQADWLDAILENKNCHNSTVYHNLSLRYMLVPDSFTRFGVLLFDHNKQLIGVFEIGFHLELSPTLITHLCLTSMNIHPFIAQDIEDHSRLSLMKLRLEEMIVTRGELQSKINHITGMIVFYERFLE